VDEFAACEDITILWGKQHGMKNEPKGQVTFVGVIPNGDLWIPDDDFYDEVGQILSKLRYVPLHLLSPLT